ncbi:BON domain-containing protein [Salidesulfovibrio brasiliensis]
MTVPARIIAAASALLAAALLCACAAAPAFEAAGMAKTGYDVAVLIDESAPKDRVDFHGDYGCTDQVLARRIRERLLIRGYTGLTANVYDGHGYLFGPAPTKKWADGAIKIASSVQGLRVLTCRFFPPSDNPIHDRDRTRFLAARMAKDKTLDPARVDAVVVGNTAVVMGVVPEQAIQDHALDMARDVDGVNEVLDYVVIVTRVDPEKNGEAPDETSPDDSE